MKKFSFNKEKAAKVAKEANAEENQQVTNANNLLKPANDDSYDTADEFLASLSKPLASNIFNRSNNFSHISNISKADYQMQKMEKCLHQRRCEYLCSDPPMRPFCAITGEAIFDMKQCPRELWGPASKPIY